MSGARSLSPIPVIVFLVVFFGLFVPLAFWLGWGDPSSFDLRGNQYPADWAQALAVATMAMLLSVPVVWIVIGRAVDIVALQFMLNGLIIIGYFFLDITGPQIFGAASAVRSGGEQAVAINAIGFFTLIGALVVWYVGLSLGGRSLPPPSAPPRELDRRLLWVLLPVLVVIGGMIASPMLLMGIVPMATGDPMAAREAIEKSSLGRPLYNLGSSLLPVIVASLLVLALRGKGLAGKIFNLPVLVVGPVMIVQFLTSNRLPIAITLLVCVALLSMEFKLPRWLLALGTLGFVVFYLGLSGFSSIIRQDRSELSEGNIVVNSFEQAFIGNNLADLRDGAWVLGKWDYEPLNGLTYLGAAGAFIPSAFFPQKKDAYLGLVALQIVEWPTEDHFGLRLSFFAESFLNFGLAGVVGLGVLMGTLFGYLLKEYHLCARAEPPCLARNVSTLLKLQLVLTFANSSEGFVFWSLLGLLGMLWVMVERPIRLKTTPWRAGESAGRLAVDHRS